MTETHPHLERVVVVGASLAGLRAAQTLREDGFDGELTIVGAEPYVPYDRPPLSKGLLTGQEQVGDIALDLSGLDATWYLGRPAQHLDPRRREVSLEDGDVLGYDGLVIATGAAPRTLRGADRLEGVHVLRTLDDALQITAELTEGPEVVISGGGWIGLEVAAACRSRQLSVTIIDPDAHPMTGRMDPAVSDMLRRLHLDHGVRFQQARVDQFEGTGRVEQVRLTDGTTLRADLAVVGIGVVPAVHDWLHDSGLEYTDGLRCDHSCRVVGADDTVAAGDVMRWDHPVFGHIRVEHWTNAADSGAAAARSLLAGPGHSASYAPPLYFWSEQYGRQISSIGLPERSLTDTRVLAGTLRSGRFVTGHMLDGRLIGAVAVDMPRELLNYYDQLGHALGHPEAGLARRNAPHHAAATTP